MGEVYKMVTNADDYPIYQPRVVGLEHGDCIFILAQEDMPRYKVGDYYDKYPDFVVTQIYYNPKKWWQFWKKKIILGYKMMYSKCSYTTIYSG